MNIRYNFRLAPEAICLIVNTVLGAVLIEAAAFFMGMSELPAWDDFRAWLIALGLSAIRTLIAAVIAAATDGFQGPGVPGPAPTPPPAE
jgi:predicted phage tail protein